VRDHPGVARWSRVRWPINSTDNFATFAGTVRAVEESIINAMIAAETMTGIENHKVMALQHDQLRAVLKKYNRLTDQ